MNEDLLKHGCWESDQEILAQPNFDAGNGSVADDFSLWNVDRMIVMRHTLATFVLLLFMTACGAPAAVLTATPPPSEPASTEPSEPAATRTLPPTEAPATALATDTPIVTSTDTPAPAVTVAPTATEPVSALSADQEQLLASLDAQGPAPEFTNEVWLNSEPLQLADLRGQVVMVEFWTYG